MQIYNKTPFQVERLVGPNRDGRDRLVIVVKATYRFAEDGSTRVADEQLPIQMADSFRGEPGCSSTIWESDLAPTKPASDVVMIGHAYAPTPKATSSEVELRVGRVSQQCIVFGERHWVRGLRGLRPSSPEPFDRIALSYERAFGGRDLSAKNEAHHAWEDRNPVGRGFVGKHSKLQRDEVLLPNIEHPTNRLRRWRTRATPVGFGFVGRHWSPRRRWAGTYDAGWEQERSPLLPRDFSERFYNGAPENLIYPGYLVGNEMIRIRGASPMREVSFDLPMVVVGIRAVTTHLRRTDLEPKLDTLVIEPDENRFSMVWRASHDVHGQLPKLGMIRVEANV